MILPSGAIKQRLKELGVGADKYLGQHFLIDETVLDAIRDVVQSTHKSNDVTVEVGPGLGVLTHLLLEEVAPVFVVEKDPVFAQNLANGLAGKVDTSALTVVQGDILEVLDTNPHFPLDIRLSHFAPLVQPGIMEPDDDRLRWPTKAKVSSWSFVANIPYAITSPLLRKLIERKDTLRHILVLVQREVAERIVAQPGSSDRGLLTLQIELAGKAEIVMIVPPSSFWPEPKVESALLRIDLAGYESPVSPALVPGVMKLATAGFAAKRKQLLNSLAAGLGKSSNEVRQKLGQAKIEPTRRAETLSLEEWARLAQVFGL